MKTVESSFQRIFRFTTGILLIIHSVALGFFALFVLFFVPLLGGIAMIAGGGNATEKQISQTWWAIGLTAVSPSIMTVFLLMASAQIMARKRPVFIAITCSIFILLYLAAAHLMLKGDWTGLTIGGLSPILVPLMAVVAAAWMKSGRLEETSGQSEVV